MQRNLYRYEGAGAVLALPEDIYNFFLPLAASIFRVGGVIVQVVGVVFLARLYGGRCNFFSVNWPPERSEALRA